jgi:Kdo-III transferase WaaZ
MAYFLDNRPAEKVRRILFYRFCRTPRHWHNREFSHDQSIELTHNGNYLLRWGDRDVVSAKTLTELPWQGDICNILASGPSISRLTRPERLFRTPIACVNGSVALAQQLGERVTYYLVSDSCFVEQKPELFAAGVQLADAVILNPKTIFAVMQRLPGVLQGVPVYLQEDLKRPFKYPRATQSQMRHDAYLLVHENRTMAYSLAPEIGTYPVGTVAYQTVQILFGAGYRRLLIFGMDLSQGRFYRENSASPCYLDKSYERTILPAFELVREYCEKTGKQLINCSLESRLPDSVIPKLDGSKALSLIETGQLSDNRQQLRRCA